MLALVLALLPALLPALIQRCRKDQQTVAGSALANTRCEAWRA